MTIRNQVTKNIVMIARYLANTSKHGDTGKYCLHLRTNINNLHYSKLLK